MATPSNVGALSLFVEDVARAKAWYETVFELPVLFEDEQSCAYRLDNTIVNLLRATEAPELIAPARVADAGSGSRFQLTIFVEDIDTLCTELVGRGVEQLNGPFDRVWGQRTACFADPDGHVWEFAQTI